MGLSAFNRARRSRKEVERLETERFKKDNAARWEAHHGRDRMRGDEEKDLEKGRKLEREASLEIGAKNEAGMEEGALVPDLPLREDHAAEIAGRNLSGVQEPKDPLDHLDERIPDSTANEKIAGTLSVDAPKTATAAQMEAVRKEFLTDDEKADEAADKKKSRDPTPDAAPLDHDADGKSGGAVTDEQVAAAAAKDTPEADKKAAEKKAADEQEATAKAAALPAAGKGAGAGKTAPTSSAAKK